MQDLRSVSSQQAPLEAPKVQRAGRAAQKQALEAKPSCLGAAAETAALSRRAPASQGGKARGDKAKGGRPKLAAVQPAAERGKKGSGSDSEDL